MKKEQDLQVAETQALNIPVVSKHYYGLLHDEELCSNKDCDCHTKEEHRVLTPFPLDVGNPYCCSKCGLHR